jgi:uncharacterized RDD family membrane protein YckC
MNSELAYPPAGLLRRLAAMAYDWLLLGSVLFAVTLVLIAARGGNAIPPGTWWYGPLLTTAAFAFYGWFWTHGGQTLGMRAWRLRVLQTNGQPLSWLLAAARFVASLSLCLPPGLGLLWMLVDRDRRCWHDRLSRTRVVHTRGASGHG